MARARDPNRDRAYEIWREHNGDITNRLVAEMLDVDEKKIAVWKQRDKWNVVQQKKSESKPDVVQQKPQQTKEGSDPNKQIPEKASKTTDKHKLFAAEYMRDFNATRAAMVVGYSKRSAYTEGWRLLKKDEVKAEIQRLKNLRENELAIDVERIIAELMKIAFADISDVIDFGSRDVPMRSDDGHIIKDADGRLLTESVQFVNVRNASEVDTTVIAEVKRTKDGVAVKLHDKLKAIEKLERYIPFMTEEEKLRMAKMRADIKAIEMRTF